MKTLILIFLSLSLKSFAETMDCTGVHNTKIVFAQRVTISSRSEFMLPKMDYLTSKIKAMGNNQFEIEVFDPSNPSRSYATAIMKNANDFVKWANWDREAIFEIACVLK